MCTLLVVQQVDRLKNMVHNKFRKDRIMKQRNVLTSAGGGGRRSTGKSCALGTKVILNCASEQRHKAKTTLFAVPFCASRARQIQDLSDPRNS